ncbi:hypothetical protein VOLCADRAFT_36996, partial [Volvox carteri f. nagariensis]
VYVGFIPHHTTEHELRQLFSTCGEVADCSIITDRHTGASRGFGFVKYATDEQALVAIERLHNYVLGGRRLVVRAKGAQRPGPGIPGGPQPPGGGGRCGGRDGCGRGRREGGGGIRSGGGSRCGG